MGQGQRSQRSNKGPKQRQVGSRQRQVASYSVDLGVEGVISCQPVFKFFKADHYEERFIHGHIKLTMSNFPTPNFDNIRKQFILIRKIHEFA